MEGDDRNLASGQILFVLDSLVHCDQDIEGLAGL